MPAITFSLKGADLSFDFGRKLTKEDLYGKAQRLVMKDGQPLKRGLLGPDAGVFAASALSTEKLDPEGTPVDEEEVLCDGEPVKVLPSSFEETAALEPAQMLELLCFAVSDLYPLTAESLPPAGLYRTWFSYRKSAERRDAMLLVRSEGPAFLMVGERKASPLVGQSVLYEFFDAESQGPAAEEEELDFSMI